MTRREAIAVTALAGSDVTAVKRASRAVGFQITVASTLVVIASVVAVLLFEHSQSDVPDIGKLGTDSNFIDVSKRDLLIGSILLGLALIILAGALGWFITRRAVRPLGEALRLQRAFVADASHELRTPLTVLDSRLQILQRSLPSGDPSDAIVKELRRDTRSLIEIVNELLESAEVTHSHSTLTAPVRLDEVVGIAVDSMKLIGEARSVEIEFSTIEPVWTEMSATSAHRCVVALLDNALRFSPDHSTVTVALQPIGSNVRLSVTDHGPGIEGIEPSQIFRRFARSASSTNQPRDARHGFGIGLALVSDIAARYGGSVRVAKSSDAGTTIELAIPRTAAAQTGAQPNQRISK